MRPQADRNAPLLSPFLLGLVAFIVASVVVEIVEPEGPWFYPVWLAVAVMIVLLGTLWLVPKHRAR